MSFRMSLGRIVLWREEKSYSLDKPATFYIQQDFSSYLVRNDRVVKTHLTVILNLFQDPSGQVAYFACGMPK